MTQMNRDVSPERLADWRLIWQAAGAARIAEELASPAMGKLVDELGVDKRAAARKWLAQHLAEFESDRRWTNRRSWIAIVLAAMSTVVAIMALYLKHGD